MPMQWRPVHTDDAIRVEYKDPRDGRYYEVAVWQRYPGTQNLVNAWNLTYGGDTPAQEEENVVGLSVQDEEFDPRSVKDIVAYAIEKGEVAPPPAWCRQELPWQHYIYDDVTITLEVGSGGEELIFRARCEREARMMLHHKVLTEEDSELLRGVEEAVASHIYDVDYESGAVRVEDIVEVKSQEVNDAT